MLQAALPDLPTWFSCSGPRSKKANISNQSGSVGNSRTFLLSWNDCWPPTFYHFLHLVCKMEAGKRGRSWTLGCSAGAGHCCLRKLPGTANQKQRAWVRKDSPSRMWEDISLSRAVVFCDFTKTTACGSTALCRGIVWAGVKCSSSGKTRLCLQPATTSTSGLL